MILWEKLKIGKGNLHLSEYQLGRNEYYVRKIITVMQLLAVKAIIDKISVFLKISPNLTFLQNRSFSKYKWKLIDQLLLLYKFYGSDM